MALLLAIAAYGINTSFAAELVTLLQYVVGVQSSMRIWEPGKSPLPAKRQGNMGRPPWLFTNGAQTINLFSVKQLGQQKRQGDAGMETRWATRPSLLGPGRRPSRKRPWGVATLRDAIKPARLEGGAILGAKMGAISEPASPCRNHPKACVLPDVFHLYKGGSGSFGIRLLSGQAIHVLHLNDYPAIPGRESITDRDRVFPGDGVAPLNQILGDLQHVNPAAVLSLEVFNPAYWKGDPLETTKTGLAKMKTMTVERIAAA